MLDVGTHVKYGINVLNENLWINRESGVWGFKYQATLFRAQK
jgi:hypothetical protein